MKHPLDWNRPAKLIRADNVVQFGDGYRQVTGPTICEGSVAELVEKVRGFSAADQRVAYIANEGGVPQTLEEIDADRADNEA